MVAFGFSLDLAVELEMSERKPGQSAMDFNVKNGCGTILSGIFEVKLSTPKFIIPSTKSKSDVA
jgi:hypothetical protein